MDSTLKTYTINETKEESYTSNDNMNLSVMVLCNNSVALTLTRSKQVLVDGFLDGDEGLRFHLLTTPPFPQPFGLLPGSSASSWHPGEQSGKLHGGFL